MLKKVQQWLFPNICCFCEQYSLENRDLCGVCKPTLPWASDRCYQCGLSLLGGGQDSIICEKCAQSPPQFDRLAGLFSYEPPITQLVTGLKFGARLAYGRILGELLADAVCEQWYQNIGLPQAVIPVPLYKSRLRKRGFNQAAELLLPLKKRVKLPVLLDICERVRPTKPQSKLDALDRKFNLKNAFQVKNSLGLEHVALVDDVVTTGSTVNAISQKLKEAGVLQVDVWCICRA